MTIAPTPLTNRICPLCGGSNECAPASAGSFVVSCWCTTATISREALARIATEQVDKACLCPRCAAGGFPVEGDTPGSTGNGAHSAGEQ